jgi:sugar lactone lactonase YvrE
MTFYSNGLRNSIIFCALLAFAQSCKKDAATSPVTGVAPAVNASKMGVALPNNPYTVYGSNFSTSPGDNIVKVDGLTARVEWATADSLGIVIPKGIHAGKHNLTFASASASRVTPSIFPPIPILVVEADIVTIAGVPQQPGYNTPSQPQTGIPGSQAYFNAPYGLAIDTVGGNLFVSDPGNHVIRTVAYTSSPYDVFTFAGPGVTQLQEPSGIITTAEPQFEYPCGMAWDGSNLWVSDFTLNRIVYVHENTHLYTGTGTPAYVNSTPINSSYSGPNGLALISNSSDGMYVADEGNYAIRTWSSFGGDVSLFAGDPGVPGLVNGSGIGARFSTPAGLAKDAQGNIYVADFYNNVIRKVTPAGVVSTYAGTGAAGFTNGAALTAATFDGPNGLAFDNSGNLYVADAYNNAIREITPAGTVLTVIGNGVAGFSDGLSNVAELHTPTGVAVDANGFIYVADEGNDCIRRIGYEIVP